MRLKTNIPVWFYNLFNLSNVKNLIFPLQDKSTTKMGSTVSIISFATHQRAIYRLKEMVFYRQIGGLNSSNIEQLNSSSIEQKARYRLKKPSHVKIMIPEYTYVEKKKHHLKN